MADPTPDYAAALGAMSPDQIDQLHALDPDKQKAALDQVVAALPQSPAPAAASTPPRTILDSVGTDLPLVGRVSPASIIKMLTTGSTALAGAGLGAAAGTLAFPGVGTIAGGLAGGAAGGALGNAEGETINQGVDDVYKYATGQDVSDPTDIAKSVGQAGGEGAIQGALQTATAGAASKLLSPGAISGFFSGDTQNPIARSIAPTAMRFIKGAYNAIDNLDQTGFFSDQNTFKGILEKAYEYVGGSAPALGADHVGEGVLGKQIGDGVAALDPVVPPRVYTSPAPTVGGKIIPSIQDQLLTSAISLSDQLVDKPQAAGVVTKIFDDLDQRLGSMKTLSLQDLQDEIVRMGNLVGNGFNKSNDALFATGNYAKVAYKQADAALRSALYSSIDAFKNGIIGSATPEEIATANQLLDDKSTFSAIRSALPDFNRAYAQVATKGETAGGTGVIGAIKSALPTTPGLGATPSQSYLAQEQLSRGLAGGDSPGLFSSLFKALGPIGGSVGAGGAVAAEQLFQSTSKSLLPQASQFIDKLNQTLQPQDAQTVVPQVQQSLQSGDPTMIGTAMTALMKTFPETRSLFDDLKPIGDRFVAMFDGKVFHPDDKATVQKIIDNSSAGPIKQGQASSALNNDGSVKLAGIAK